MSGRRAIDRAEEPTGKAAVEVTSSRTRASVSSRAATAPRKAAAKTVAKRATAEPRTPRTRTTKAATAERSTTAKPSEKAVTKKATARSTEASAEKAVAKKAPAEKASATKSPRKKAPAKAVAKKTSAEKALAKKSPAKKASTTKKVAKQTAASKPARSSGRRDALPDGVMQQIDTTPDDAAGAILLAAMELMGSKGPAKVSLRDIAGRAGVNYGLIHRHFGTKDSLLLGIFQAFTDYGATIIRSSETIHEAVEGTFNADSGRYADLLASAVIDGMDPHRLYVDSSGMADFAAHITREWTEPSAEFERRREFDPRVVGSFVMLMIVVWDFYAPYMQVVNGYEDRDLAEVRGEVLDLMKYLVTAAAPDA